MAKIYLSSASNVDKLHPSSTIYASFILEYITVYNHSVQEDTLKPFQQFPQILSSSQQEIEMATTFSSTVCKIVLMVAVAMVALFPTGELPLFIYARLFWFYKWHETKMLFLLAQY